jgi:hypothetical protein
MVVGELDQRLSSRPVLALVLGGILAVRVVVPEEVEGEVAAL